MTAVSMVVDVAANQTPARFVASVDALTLPVEDFEVVFVAPESTGEAETLHSIANYRPNVRVLERRVGEVRPPWRDTLEGQYVLHVATEDVLFPESLSRLLEFARHRELDAVAGRRLGVDGAEPGAFATDCGPCEPPVSKGLVWMVRADLLDRTDESRYYLGGKRCGVMASYPVLLTEASPTLVRDRWECHDAQAEWVGDGLRLTTTLEGLPVDRAVLRLRHLTLHESYLLPATVQHLAGEQATPTLHLKAGIPVLSAAASRPLPTGRWLVEFIVEDSDRTIVSHVPTMELAPALVGGIGVVAGPPDDGRLTLDVGPTVRPLLSQLSPDGAIVTESAAGSLLQVPLPKLHVSHSHGLKGLLGLGSLALPARIAVGEGASLQAVVSGLTGSVALSAQFGKAPMRPCGITLDIDPLGAMSVSATPLPAPKPKSRSTGAPEDAAGRTVKSPPSVRPSGPVAALRRSIPKSLDPVARRLAAVPFARAAYRKLTRSS